MGNIIAFAGRLQSGKTELANICTQYGYEKLYFAQALKELIANLIYGTIDDVNKYKNGSEDGKWNKVMKDNDLIFISQETNIPIQFIAEKLKNVIFHNTRDMLQVIGTDIIREKNPNWHVEKLKEQIDPNKKYVIDDVRFENECQCIEDLGGDIWFVVRPIIDNVSHHISEETLKWQDFHNIIVNKYSKEYLQLMWKMFMENDYEKTKHIRETLINKLSNDKDYLNQFLKNNNPLDVIHFTCISEDLFTYDDRFSKSTSKYKLKQETNTSVMIIADENETIINNALEIEDLKKLKE